MSELSIGFFIGWCCHMLFVWAFKKEDEKGDLIVSFHLSLPHSLTSRQKELIEGLKDIPYSQLNGDPVKRLPGNVNWSFEGVEGESLLLHLDMYGIECSSGSACTSESLDPSHVLLGMGVPIEAAHGSLRFSLDIDNTEEQIDYIIEKVHQVVELYRGMSPYWEDLLTGKREHCIPEYWNK